MKPLSSDDQKAALGNVRRKPVQIDLLTGNLAPKKVRIPRGDDHIRLKPLPGEKSAIPGMAHFAGSGPAGKRCYQCEHLQDIKVWGRNCSTPEMAGQKDDAAPRRTETNACRKSCELFEGRVQQGGIEYESACKYFVAKSEGQ